MKLTVGNEFGSIEAHFEDEKEAAPVIDAVAQVHLGVTRKSVVYALMAMAAFLLFGAAFYGVWDGSFNELQAVWLCIAPFVGMIVGHYFPALGEGNGKEG